MIDDRRQNDRRAATADRRGKPRLRVLISATLETSQGEQPVRLRNLSSTGALVEGQRLPELGAQVRFKRGRIDMPAMVVWVTATQAGLEFIAPIPEAEVLVHIRKVEAAQA